MRLALFGARVFLLAGAATAGGSISIALVDDPGIGAGGSKAPETGSADTLARLREGLLLLGACSVLSLCSSSSESWILGRLARFLLFLFAIPAAIDGTSTCGISTCGISTCGISTCGTAAGRLGEGCFLAATCREPVSTRLSVPVAGDDAGKQGECRGGEGLETIAAAAIEVEGPPRFLIGLPFAPYLISSSFIPELIQSSLSTTAYPRVTIEHKCQAEIAMSCVRRRKYLCQLVSVLPL